MMQTLEGAGEFTDQVLGTLLMQPKLEVPRLHAGQPYEAVKQVGETLRPTINRLPDTEGWAQ